jgi:hypothetical protein
MIVLRMITIVCFHLCQLSPSTTFILEKLSPYLTDLRSTNSRQNPPKTTVWRFMPEALGLATVVPKAFTDRIELYQHSGKTGVPGEVCATTYSGGAVGSGRKNPSCYGALYPATARALTLEQLAYLPQPTWSNLFRYVRTVEREQTPARKVIFDKLFSGHVPTSSSWLLVPFVYAYQKYMVELRLRDGPEAIYFPVAALPPTTRARRNKTKRGRSIATVMSSSASSGSTSTDNDPEYEHEESSESDTSSEESDAFKPERKRRGARPGVRRPAVAREAADGHGVMENVHDGETSYVVPRTRKATTADTESNWGEWKGAGGDPVQLDGPVARAGGAFPFLTGTRLADDSLITPGAYSAAKKVYVVILSPHDIDIVMIGGPMDGFLTLANTRWAFINRTSGLSANRNQHFAVNSCCASTSMAANVVVRGHLPGKRLVAIEGIHAFTIVPASDAEIKLGWFKDLAEATAQKAIPLDKVGRPVVNNLAAAFSPTDAAAAAAPAPARAPAAEAGHRPTATSRPRPSSVPLTTLIDGHSILYWKSLADTKHTSLQRQKTRADDFLEKYVDARGVVKASLQVRCQGLWRMLRYVFHVSYMRNRERKTRRAAEKYLHRERQEMVTNLTAEKKKSNNLQTDLTAEKEKSGKLEQALADLQARHNMLQQDYNQVTKASIVSRPST